MTPAEAIDLIEAATGPGDLFGADPARTFRRLARLTHPDAGTGDPRAERAFTRLADLWRRYRDWDGRVLVARGDLANLYRDPRGLLKVGRDPADNDLIEREARALARLAARGDPRFAAYFPRLIEAVRVPGSVPGAVHRGHVITALDGFVSLAQVRAAFPGGVHPADAAWIWRRLLVAIGAAHRAGLIHGAVLPEHVLLAELDEALARLFGPRRFRPFIMPAHVG